MPAPKTSRPLRLLTLLLSLIAPFTLLTTGAFGDATTARPGTGVPDAPAARPGDPAFLQSAELKPEAIIQKMIEQYRTISSYASSGTAGLKDTNRDSVEGFRRDANGELAYRTRTTFTLSFTRPKQLYFEWESTALSESERYGRLMPHPGLLTSTGDEVTFTSTTRGTRKVESLEDGLGSVYLFSGVEYVIKLLMKDEEVTKNFTELAKLKRLGSEKLDGEDCHIITGQAPWTGSYAQHAPVYKLWVGKTDFLLRKVVVTRTYPPEMGGGMSTVDEVHSNVRFNYGPAPDAITGSLDKRTP